MENRRRTCCTAYRGGFLMEQTACVLSVRQLGPEDGRDVLALYRQCGRDGAWCGAGTVDAVLDTGTWWGGFAEGALCFCAAFVPAGSGLPQAEMLRTALSGDAAETLLLPPAISEEGAARAGAILPMLLEAWRADSAETRLAAAVPMKYPPVLLGGYLAAGLSAFRTRPLLSLRPNYLLAHCDVKAYIHGTVDKFYMPLEGTLAVSRLLEQGYCITGLRCLPPDDRLMAELRERDIHI